MRVSTAQNEMPIWALLTDKDVPKCLCTKWQLHFYCSKGVWEWWGLAASLSAFPWHILNATLQKLKHKKGVQVECRISPHRAEFPALSLFPRVLCPLSFIMLHHVSLSGFCKIKRDLLVSIQNNESSKFNPVQCPAFFFFFLSIAFYFNIPS